MNKQLYCLVFTVASTTGFCSASSTPKNLIRNGDFESKSSKWRGDHNIVFETAAETNRICRIKVDPDESITFYQDIDAKNTEHMTIRFKVKKSSDYEGNEMAIRFDRGNGLGGGTSQKLPDNTGWNEMEWGLRGGARMTVIFEIKRGQSGTLSFDDIEIVKKSEPKSAPTIEYTNIADEYHTFTDKSGRAIEAKITAIDPTETKVTLERKGSLKSATVPIAAFNDDTQAFILSWSQISAFFDNKEFSIELQRNVKKVADESTQGKDWSTASVYYDHHIELIIHNKSEHAFNDVKFEYTLYYTQKIWGIKRESQGTLYDKARLNLPPKSKKAIKTKQIILHTYSQSSGGEIKGELQGMLVHLSFETLTGETITREIAYPENRKFTWTTKTRDVQRKVSF